MAYVLQSYQSYADKGIRIGNRQGDELMQSIRRKLERKSSSRISRPPCRWRRSRPEPGFLPRRSLCW